VAGLAHQMATEFAHVTADIIEANEFPDLSQRYQVTGVPKTIVNDKVEFLGAVPEEHFVAAIQQAMGTLPEEGESTQSGS
jgi:predicted DsbA family dithiol-disulfide isomerase